MREATPTFGVKGRGKCVVMTSLKFPEELLRSPRCLIALSGLDTRNNAVHRAVWDEFTSGGRRSERKPVFYCSFPADHLYPKASVRVRLRRRGEYVGRFGRHTCKAEPLTKPHPRRAISLPPSLFPPLPSRPAMKSTSPVAS